MIALRHHQRGGHPLPKPRQTESQRLRMHGVVRPMETERRAWWRVFK